MTVAGAGVGGGGGGGGGGGTTTAAAVSSTSTGGLLAEDGVVLSVSTLGCSAAPFFRAARLVLRDTHAPAFLCSRLPHADTHPLLLTHRVEHCLTGLPFFDVLTLDGGSSNRGLVPGTIVELYGPSGTYVHKRLASSSLPPPSF